MLIQSMFDGLILGGIYATIATGLSLAFGIMGIINWSHGEMLMVSMYLSYALITFLGFDPYLTLVINAMIMFAVGYLIQKYIFSNLMKRDSAREPMSVLLSTAGLGMLLSNSATMFFGSRLLTTKTAYTGKTIWLGSYMFSVPRLISFSIAIAVTAGLYILLRKTNWGRALRATSQNRQTAQLMGIPNNKVFSIAFGISLALVGVAGALLSPNFAVYPTVGEVYSNRAFIIVVLAGKGNIRGALICGMIIGLIERMGALLINEATGQLLTFVLFVIILLVRPQGLFNKHGSVTA